MSELPPRPPRLPPGFFRHYVWMICINLLALYMDLKAAHLYARDDVEVMLFIMCVLSTITLALLWVWARRTIRTLREWRDLRRAWDQMNAFMNEREQRK